MAHPSRQSLQLLGQNTRRPQRNPTIHRDDAAEKKQDQESENNLSGLDEKEALNRGIAATASIKNLGASPGRVHTKFFLNADLALFFSLKMSSS